MHVTGTVTIAQNFATRAPQPTNAIKKETNNVYQICTAMNVAFIAVK